MPDKKDEKPEACECGCGGCEKQERYYEYIKRRLRETEEKDAKL